MEDINSGHPIFLNIAVQYLRPKLAAYAKDTLQKIITELIADKDLDLEVDPVTVRNRINPIVYQRTLNELHQIYRAHIDLEETRQGVPSKRPKDVSFREALQDPDTRGEYIRRMCTAP